MATELSDQHSSVPQETRNNDGVTWDIGGRTLSINKYNISPPYPSSDEEENSGSRCRPSGVRRRCCNKFWNDEKPHPLCPPLKHLLRFVALIIFILMIWGSAYSELGHIAGPEGQLFKIGFLGVTAYIAGLITKKLKLPSLLGMMLMGILLRNINFVVFSGPYLQVTAALREMALFVIIMSAGLELDPVALKKLGFMVTKLLLVPVITEAIFIAVMTYFLLNLPWIWGFLLGALLAAISPAVVLTSLFQIQKHGNYGVSKGIPTLIIAVTSIDDILCITIFGVLLSIINSTGSLLFQIISGPAGVAIGVSCGMTLGLILRYIPHKKDKRATMLRTLLLVGGGLLLMFGSTAIGFGSAGALGCIIYAYVASNGWDPKEKHSVNDNFRMLWDIFEPILFGLIGNEIDIFVLHGTVVGLGTLCLLVALLARTASAALVATGGNFNWKEKLFISLAWIPKANVQAALAPVALDTARALNLVDNFEYANILLIIGVLSILISAPLGSIVITTFGPKLLKKDDENTQPALV